MPGVEELKQLLAAVDDTPHVGKHINPALARMAGAEVEIEGIVLELHLAAADARSRLSGLDGIFFTLAFKGEKYLEALIQDKGALEHAKQLFNAGSPQE